MKDRPILLSGPMVSATLEGRKTMTRRVVKPEVPKWTKRVAIHSDGTAVAMMDTIGTGIGKCPYGQPGDRLWVRESFADRDRDGDSIVAIYRADGEEYEDGDGFTYTPKWHPSIHMPRKLSRLTLEIVSVRVERLQDITDDDAEAEGVDITNASIPGYCRERFRKLWNSIYAKRGYGWDANPWVWVVEFRRLP